MCILVKKVALRNSSVKLVKHGGNELDAVHIKTPISGECEFAFYIKFA